MAIYVYVRMSIPAVQAMADLGYHSWTETHRGGMFNGGWCRYTVPANEAETIVRLMQEARHYATI